MQSFSNYKSWWSKELQWEYDIVLFLHCFLVVVEIPSLRMSQKKDGYTLKDQTSKHS